MMKTLLHVVAIAVFVAALSVGVARAQQQPQNQPTQDQTPGQQAPEQGPIQPQAPIPAYRSPLAGAAANDEEEAEAPPLAPDTQPVTGVQNFTLGVPTVHSYWEPHFDVTSTVDSNPTLAVNEVGVPTGWGTWVSLTGGVDIHRVTEGNDLELGYVGGGTFSQNTGAANGTIQELSFDDKYMFRSWTLSFIDNLNYLPETAFGYAGPGAGGAGGGTQVGTGQDLLVGRGQNLGNTFQTEADVFLTARSSLTFVGGYSDLNYFDSDLLNYGSENFRAGYNYLLDRKNTVGVQYNFKQINYTNFHQSIMVHTAELTYGRRITGRLAFQIAAGPEIGLFQTPIMPAAGGTGPTGGAQSSVGWALNTNLLYRLSRTVFGLAYMHGINGGAGIQAGAEADTASGSITRQLTRALAAGVDGGYSRSSGLTAVNTTTPFGQTFDYWYGGGNIGYALNRTIRLTTTYQLQYQDAGTAFCLGMTCGTSLVRHTITFGVTWHDQPVPF